MESYLSGEDPAWLELLMLLFSRTKTSASCSFKRTVFASTSYTHTHTGLFLTMIKIMEKALLVTGNDIHNNGNTHTDIHTFMHAHRMLNSGVTVLD